ncbi:MAG: BatD family protein [Mariprofundus sp.]|nr:BatD family protein [Mariprofundus sp.]
MVAYKLNPLKVSFIGLLFLLNWLLITPVFAAVNAQVDRQQMAEGESVNLTVTLSGDDSGKPETAVLEKDFEILSRNHSSAYSFINGSIGSSDTWQFSLRPRRGGELLIPAIKVGKTTTTPMMIKVKKVAARSGSGGMPTGDIWLEMVAAPESVWVQQQTILTIKIYQSVAMSQAQLSEPKSDHAVVEKLGDDKQYQVNDHGKNWRVTERKYALFPQQSGTMTIEPVQLDAAIVMHQRGYGASMFQSTKPLRVLSNKINIEVKPIVSLWNQGDWLPSSKLMLTETWPKGETFKLGEPITRTLTLQAEGLSESQLPPLPLLLPDNLKSYPDQPVLHHSLSERGIRSSRQEKIAIIPTVPGTYILPAIEIPWWNVNSGKIELAALPARSFKVVGTLMTPVVPPAATSQPVTAIEAVPSIAMDKKESQWKMIALFALFGWIVTLLILLFNAVIKKRAPTEKKLRTYEQEGFKQAKGAFLTACNIHDAKGCERALISMAAIQWPNSAASLHAWHAYNDVNLNQALRALERALYSSANEAWKGDTLLTAFRQLDLNRQSQKKSDKKLHLPDLYPEPLAKTISGD